MATLCITSDFHLDDNPLNAYRHEFQKQLCSIVKKHGVELLLMLGDVCEAKDHHSAWLVNKVVEHFDKLRGLCNVVIVQGNHDFVDINSPFYQFLKHIDGIDWISEPTDNQAGMDLAFAALGKVLLLPHSNNPKKDWAGLKLKSYNWVFTHATFQGAFAAPGVTLRGIPTDTFGNARVISGDIHVPQIINGSRVEYVGAPYAVDFGDSYQPRVLLIEDGRLRSIPVTGSQKRLVEAEFVDGDIVLHGFNASPGDILKVRVAITNEQRADWPGIKAKVREWGESEGYLVHVVQPVLGKQAKKGISKPQHTHQTDEALLASYARRNGIDNLTLKAGQNLLRKV